MWWKRDRDWSGTTKAGDESICEAVEHLLSSECVVSNLVPGRVFRVVRGSGMGHRHSGCIADSSFFALGEREFAARSQVFQSFGIKRYYRYRDDV